jgi:hypothetical protein
MHTFEKKYKSMHTCDKSMKTMARVKKKRNEIMNSSNVQL